MFQVSLLIAVASCLIQYSGAAPTDFHSSGGYSGVANVGGPVGYNGPKAVPVILPDGHIADTPAVSAAKNAHYSALAQAKSSQTYSAGAQSSFGGHFGGVGAGGAGANYGPQAVPVVLPSGHLADTSEVAAAKGRHYSALAQASASSGFSDGDDGSYKQGGGYHH